MKSPDEVKCFTCKKWKPVSSCLPMNSWQTYKTFYECNQCRGIDMFGFKIISNNSVPIDTIVLRKKSRR